MLKCWWFSIRWNKIKQETKSDSVFTLRKFKITMEAVAQIIWWFIRNRWNGWSFGRPSTYRYQQQTSTNTQSRALENNHKIPSNHGKESRKSHSIKGFGHELKVKHQNLCLYNIIIPDNLPNKCTRTAYWGQNSYTTYIVFPYVIFTHYCSCILFRY